MNVRARSSGCSKTGPRIRRTFRHGRFQWTPLVMLVHRRVRIPHQMAPWSSPCIANPQLVSIMGQQVQDQSPSHQWTTNPRLSLSCNSCLTRLP